ncbi:Nucleotidyltransferase [Trametes versicolor FP-101664 SS1]|uniref:Nucleotidyltransferase n=1 Tax=Trametes versicolor (strain FP-101664) TaxID=717944 RepID=UPI00046248DC|nr:Nucleotidyltransferase [Trametes versicolor FP-101664 SS1]EIW53979.1 Nucleotidyltransferase [Trametes versicolor FP-101664 SS1]
MPFKRPAPNPTQSASASGSSSSSGSPPPAKRSKASMTKSLPEIKVYLVQAKLDAAAIAELLTLGERHTKGVCENAADADIILTAISMRRRFERHVPWDIATSKAVVTPQWLRDSIEHGSALPCGDYVAIEDLHETTVKNCPDCNCKPCACADSSASALSPSSSPRRSAAHGPGHLPSPPTSPCTSRHDASGQAAPIPAHLLPPDPPNVTDLEKLNYMSLYACQRASPLVCPNQDLARELDIIRQSRALEGEDRSALSYQRAISVIKAYPERIRSLKQVQKLPYIGVKISGLVDEFLDNGHISEAQTIKSSERFRTLSLFTSIYGIGPHAARRLFALGLRSLADLEIYYGVEPSSSPTQPSQIVEVEPEKSRQAGWKGPGKDKDKGGQDEGLGESWIRVALGLREDLSKMIPRDEVEEIGRVVMRELDALEPGCVSTIVGGYRRGKTESNDVDIVFTHPDAGKVKGLCKRFVKHLHERGMVTHVMHLSSFHAHDPLRTTHWDTLEKSLTVFVLPRAGAVRRRLDLIFAPPEVYWTAVVGWSGSIMFQRDLRQWAKDRCGMKFDSSGITRRYDSKEFHPRTEKEVFELLGLEWVDPVWRNADL